MWIRITEIKLPAKTLGEKQKEITTDAEMVLLQEKICKILGFTEEQGRTSILKTEIFRRSPDLRKKDEPLFVYTVDAKIVDVKLQKALKNIKSKEISVITKSESIYEDYINSLRLKTEKNVRKEKSPVVVGFGPAGMFAALILAEMGLKPIVLERGQSIEGRVSDVELFNQKGILNVNSNIQFGEGGAGTFSDGKLNSLIKDKDTVGRFVLETFVKFGAPRDILYRNKPHIGTDILRRIVKNIREYIISKGGNIKFNTRLIELMVSQGKIEGVKAAATEKNSVEEILTDAVVLAIGHSARDTFSLLKEQQVAMEKKPFSVGVRIEHLQESIDKAQYGHNATLMKELNGAADYKLSHRASNGRGVYTFCMCPGGFVVGAASEEGRLVTNGMSNFNRAGKNANAALLVSIMPEDFAEGDVLSGVEFQRRIEEKAFAAGGGDWKAPCQLVGDFMRKKESDSLGRVEPTFSNGVKLTDLNLILPKEVNTALHEGISDFGKKIKGFDDYEALLTGCETRSSSPVRILRNAKGDSLSIKGLLPAGEGAGYAGGILSAASDGIKIVEKWMDNL